MLFRPHCPYGLVMTDNATALFDQYVLKILTLVLPTPKRLGLNLAAIIMEFLPTWCCYCKNDRVDIDFATNVDKETQTEQTSFVTLACRHCMY